MPNAHTRRVVLGLAAWLWPALVACCSVVSIAAAEDAPAAPSQGTVVPGQPPGETVSTTASVPAEPEGYSEAIDAALREHELGHFEEAHVLLVRAHELMPSARTLRGLGKVEYELRNYGQAVHYLEAALTSQVRPLDAHLRADVEQVLERARAYVGEVHVNVNPGSAHVIVDGITVASGPQASFSLLVGDHVIEFRADGHLPERRAIHIKGGDETNIQVILSTPPGETARAAQLAIPFHRQDERDERPLRKSPWLWTGVAIVTAAVATAVAIATTRDHDSVAAPHQSTSSVVLQNP